MAVPPRVRTVLTALGLVLAVGAAVSTPGRAAASAPRGRVVLLGADVPDHVAWFEGEGYEVDRRTAYPGGDGLAGAALLYVVAYADPGPEIREEVRRWVRRGGRAVFEAGALLHFAGRGDRAADEIAGGGVYANASGPLLAAGHPGGAPAWPDGLALGVGGPWSAGHAPLGGSATVLARWADAPGLAAATWNAHGAGEHVFVSHGPAVLGNATWDAFWASVIRGLLDRAV